MNKRISLLFLCLCSDLCLYSQQSVAADCTEADGNSVNIAADCQSLSITGDSPNVTIDSGVTVNSTGVTAVTTAGSSNASITNNGTISATTNRAFRTSGSDVNELINYGTITAGGREGVRNGGTITTLRNVGTISATSTQGIHNNTPGTITTLTNSGTISAVEKQAINNKGIIGTLTNSGTISAGNESNDVDYGLNNAGTIGTLTNSGTISVTNRYGLNNSGTITTLENSGTISAGANYAIANTPNGVIGTFTNTGTLTPTGATAISNNGSLTTFNNLQGRSGSNPVTFTNNLPTNYNVIVKSPTNYGQIEFSSVSGTTNFGVHSTSTLAADTTYSSVITGLSNSEISSGTSGSIVSGSSRFDWTLENSSGNVWDLVVAANQDITDDTNNSVTTSVKPNVVLGMNNLTSVTEVNFANMNTYDCDLFDTNKICLSLGSRHTSINTPKTEVDSGVIVAGYKFSDNLRVAGFYHSNSSHKTPASFQLSDKTPLTGVLIVWNQNPNHLGYQLKLANAQQQKHATFTREVVGTSEEGKGQTVLGAKSYVAELQYGYQYSDNTVLRPYFAARSAVIKQEAYTETGNSSPLTFNEIKDKSTTILLGLKSNTDLNQKLSLKGSVGIEYDIEHSVDKLAPTGISGLSTVSLTDDFNKTRPVLSLGFDYALTSNQRISGTLQYQELPYLSKTETNAYLNYTIGI